MRMLPVACGAGSSENELPVDSWGNDAWDLVVLAIIASSGARMMVSVDSSGSNAVGDAGLGAGARA